MRNVQDKKDVGLATAVGVGFALFAGIAFANASAPTESPVAPATVVNAEVSHDASGGVIKSEVSGGKLASK